MKKRIGKRVIDQLQPGEIIADDNPVGFVARRLPSGVVTYGFRYRSAGRQHWIGLGRHGDVTAEQARTKALQVAKEVRQNKQPLSAREQAAQKRLAVGGTVNTILDAFLARHVRPKLRSAAEIERCFAVYVRPRLGSKPLYELRRRDVVELLDGIEDQGAPVMADRVLAHLRKAFNWQAARDDAFTPPIVKGMARTKPTERARKRMLDDQELRDLRAALDSLEGVPACFPAFVWTLLLSAQRLRMVSLMRADEIDGNDWVIPAERNKGGVEHVVPMSGALADVFADQCHKGYVFTSDGGQRSFSGFSKAKAALDQRLLEIRKQARRSPMKPWTFHDLRRTARSLMSRAKVPSEVAERVIAHVIPGVRGVYDRYQYRDEKRDALERLAVLIERILLHPGEGGTVVEFPAKSA